MQIRQSCALGSQARRAQLRRWSHPVHSPHRLPCGETEAQTGCILSRASGQQPTRGEPSETSCWVWTGTVEGPPPPTSEGSPSEGGGAGPTWGEGDCA